MKIIIAAVLLLTSVARAEDLSLNQALDMALKQNAGLKIVEYKIRASEGQLMAARGYLAPQLSASGSIVRLNSLVDMKPGPEYYLPVLDSGSHASTDYIVPMSGGVISSDKIGNTYAGKLSASWPIYTGGKIWQGYQISRLNKNAVEESYNKSRTEIILSVKKAYYGLALTRSALAVTKEAVASLGKHVDRVRTLYQKGMVSRYDLLRAEVQFSNMQPAVINLENAVVLSEQSLNMLLNRELEAHVSIGDTLEAKPVILDSASLVKMALEARPDYKEIIIRQQMAARARTISYSGFQPSIALVADYSYSKGQGFSGTEEWQRNWDVGIAASWILFDGMASAGKLKEARANYQQLQLAKEQIEDGIMLEVTSNFLTLRANQKSLQSQEKSVEQAQEALRIAQARYESGQATNLDVLDTEVALTQAKTNKIQAVHDYLVSLAKLENAVGRPLQ